MTIVLSDDNILVLNKLNLLLSEFKDCVVLGCAMDGNKTIELVNKEKPDLLIMDIEMPKPNGIEVAQYINRCKIPTVILALSNHDIYEYVRSVMRAGAVDYILKHELSTELLRKKLDEVCAVIQQRRDDATQKKYFSLYAKQKFLFNLLNDNGADFPENRLIVLEEEFSGTCHVVVCMQITNFIDFDDKRYRLVQNVINICNGIFLKTGSGVGTYLQNGMFAVLLRADESMGQLRIQSEMQKIMALIQSNLTRILNLDTIYSHEIFWGPVENLHTYYKLANERLNKTSYGGIKKKGGDSGTYTISVHDGMVLNNAIYRADSTEIATVVKKIFEDSTCQGITGVLSAIYELYSLGKKYLMQFEDNCYQVEIDPIPKIKSILDVHYVEAYFISFFMKIVQCNCKKDSHETYSAHIKNALLYIHQNYADDISLDIISGNLNLSNVYFSHLFKTETGKTFTGYLTDYRIQMAKGMLLNTSYSIKAIAKKTGFRNYNYFMLVFRKITGETPLSFRRTSSERAES